MVTILALAPAGVWAQIPVRTHELRALSADDSAVTREIVQALKERYPALQASSDVKALAVGRGAAVYIALGPSALRAALVAELESPVISLFTSSQSYVDLASRARIKRSQVTAIYAEAAPDHQMQLIRALFGRRVTVGTLISEHTEYLTSALRAAARGANLELDIQRVKREESVVRALTRLAPATAILIVPDPSVYTAATLRDILESTYRRNQPVVGFSSATVAAGTMATAYSTIDDVVAQLDEVLHSIGSGKIPEPKFPRYWRVSINENVARSLNVVVSDEVRALGERPPERSR